VAAVILVGLVSLNYLDSPVKGKVENYAAKESIFVEEKSVNSLGGGLLGGPGNLSLTTIPAAEAAFDFTSDDSQEDQDLAILTGSGLVSQDSPVPPGADPFISMSKEVIAYVVQTGDTPFDIAIKFGINTDTILAANNMRDGDLIRPGDKLIILPLNGIRVKVVAKDTVTSLAKKYSGKTEEIIAFNELSPDGKLTVNGFIIIPDGEPLVPVSRPSPKVTAPKYAKEMTPLDNWLIAPASGYNWGRIHGRNAVDVSSSCGTPIYAAAAGKIIISDSIGWNYGYGKYVEIRHPNGVTTLYGHGSQLLVNSGDEVVQGQLIMLMGTTGRSSGCHVHFEVRGAKNPLAR